MWNRVQRSEKWIYRSAIAFVLVFWVAHVVSLPVEITYDGLGYIDLSDVLGSPRFPADWNQSRTPLLPLSLKIAFLVFGRQAISAILVPALYALAGILLLGASVKRVGGRLAAAGTLVLVSVFPTLVAYQHSVLTESGSFFFVSLTLYILLSPSKRPWLRTAALALALGAGFYWRQNVLTLAPVAALLLGFGMWREFRTPFREFLRTHHPAELLPLWPLAAHMLAVVLVSALLTMPWSPYLQTAALRDVSLQQGVLRQSLLPPEHPFVGPYRDDYYRAIRSSIYHRNYLSGMRWDLMSELAGKIWARPVPKPMPQFFLELVKQNPGRYLNGLGRTLLFYAGVNGVESDNRSFRDEILSETLQGSKISVGPEPLRSRIQHDFEQRTTSSLIMRFVRGMIFVYEPLLILASILTVLGLATAILLRDVRLLAFCAIPCAYALSYAVILVSLDRFMVPVYPLSLANAILVPLALYRRFGAKGRMALERILAAARPDIPPPATVLAPRVRNASQPPLPHVELSPLPVEIAGIQEEDGAGIEPPGSVRRWTPAVIVLLLLPMHMIAALFQLHHRIPWGDLVNLFCSTELYNGLTWSKLIAFSNEHRVAFTRLVVFFDYTVLHGANLSPYVAAAALGLLPPVVCYFAFRRLAPGSLTRGQALVAGSLSMAIYFNGNQTMTLFDPIMLQHYFVNAFALAAAWALSVLLFGDVRRAGFAAAALFAAGFCGSFSSATGILIVPATGLASVVILAARGWKALAARWKALGFLLWARRSGGRRGRWNTPHLSGSLLSPAWCLWRWPDGWRSRSSVSARHSAVLRHFTLPSCPSC
ncbi:MAG: glycosyltransferase family 39 protein [Candidatus Solibacter sp.]|nr:glycosyltransferase family 39 protein [Candidatus Solibacter sp.]